MKLNADSQTIVIGAGVALGLYLFAKHEAGKALNAINPVSNENIFNSGANAIVDATSNYDSIADAVLSNRGKPNFLGFIDDLIRPDK